MAASGPIVFNTVLNDQSPNIAYDAVSGTFTISAVGNYYVDWWVAIISAGLSLTSSFGISVNGGAPIIGESPLITGQVSGNALITVAAAPATVQLVNTTGNIVTLSLADVQANITILEVTV